MQIKYNHKYTVGQHEVVCGYANHISVNKLLQGRTIDLIYTDPAWTQHFCDMFRSKAGEVLPKQSMEDHLAELVKICVQVHPRQVAIEINDKYLEHLRGLFAEVGIMGERTFRPMYGKNTPYNVWIGSFDEPGIPFGDTIDGKLFTGEAGDVGEFLLRNLQPRTMMEVLVGEGRYLPPFVKAGVKTYGFDFIPEKIEKTLKMYKRYVKAEIEESIF